MVMMPASTAVLVAFVCFGCALLVTNWFSLIQLSELKDCHPKTVGLPSNPDRLSMSSDPWNLNDHHVIYTRSNDEQETQVGVPQPIGSPGLEKDVADLSSSSTPEGHQDLGWSTHHLGIIVPYRDRFEELKEFVPHMNIYLNSKKIRHSIFIINQVDKHRFNRASLINIGFLMAVNESCDYIAMHDVDLLPLNPDLNYGYPEAGPFHVSGPMLHPKYHYRTFVGGILLVSAEHFELLNGLSNKFWGWGREDDEFYARIIESGLQVHRHGEEITTGYDTFKHVHDSEKRKRDYARIGEQRRAQFRRDRQTGLSTTKYEIVKKQILTVDSYPCTVVDVKVFCNHTSTPWCDLPKAKKT